MGCPPRLNQRHDMKPYPTGLRLRVLVIDTLRGLTVCMLYFLAGRFGYTRLCHFFLYAGEYCAGRFFVRFVLLSHEP